jgi:hypothetical protein
MKNKHTDVCRPAKEKDGRKWKKRCPAKLNYMVVIVLKTKDGDPTPSDVIKTAANECGIMLPYVTAYFCNNKGCQGRTELNCILRSHEIMQPHVSHRMHKEPHQ